MEDNYSRIVQNNLEQLYSNLPSDLAAWLPARQEGGAYFFDAFGEKCMISPERIGLGEKSLSPILGIIISLYALNARSDICIPAPFKAFKDFPDSMPYVGAFATHTEQPLVPHLEKVKEGIPKITETLNGGNPPLDACGDFSFIVYPLPKIALRYIFYEADEDFPPSVTCLFSNNANLFLPVDGLADLGEYTSKKILELIGGRKYGV